MMLYRSARRLLKPYLLQCQRQCINHIKNMNEENLRVKAEELSREPTVIPNNRVYKPTYTIEFNREGEVLIYSADPLKNETFYFKYPYIFCTYGLTNRRILYSNGYSQLCPEPPRPRLVLELILPVFHSIRAISQNLVLERLRFPSSQAFPVERRSSSEGGSPNCR